MSNQYDALVIGNGANNKRAVVVKGKAAEGTWAPTFARKQGVAEASKKTGGTNKVPAVDHQRIAALDRNNEVAPPPKVLPTVGKAIAKARQDLELGQKDLAQKVNEKPSVIQDYENGSAIPNNQVLGKLERALGVKLRGQNIGEPLTRGGKTKEESGKPKKGKST